MTTRIVIVRRERSEGRGNPSCLGGGRTGLSLRSLVHSGSPRAFSHRDVKVKGQDALAMTRWRKELVVHSLCHCEERAEARDAAIHRVSGYAYDLSLRLLDHSGSPRPQGARDDKTRVGKRSEVSSPSSPSAMSVILPYIAPLLLLLETYTEA
jgi:hypothetical protein